MPRLSTGHTTRICTRVFAEDRTKTEYLARILGCTSESITRYALNSFMSRPKEKIIAELQLNLPDSAWPKGMPR